MKNRPIDKLLEIEEMKRHQTSGPCPICHGSAIHQMAHGGIAEQFFCPKCGTVRPPMNLPPNLMAGIYQEVDGFFYYDPSQLGAGCYAAHTLRQIADKLDEMNQPWEDQIRNSLEAVKKNLDPQ